MQYENYTNQDHEKIGFKILNKDVLKTNSGDITYITKSDILDFCHKYSNIDDILISDILKIWSFEEKIKFYYYGGIMRERDISFVCHEWIQFKPIMFIILQMISYFKN